MMKLRIGNLTMQFFLLGSNSKDDRLMQLFAST